MTTSEHDDCTPKLYRIVRFFRDSRPPIRRRGRLGRLTLQAAQAHCRRDDTHGTGWFDGYEAR